MGSWTEERAQRWKAKLGTARGRMAQDSKPCASQASDRPSLCSICGVSATIGVYRTTESSGFYCVTHAPQQAVRIRALYDGNGK